MRKLLIILCLFFSFFANAQFNPSIHTVVNDAIGQAQAAPIDGRTMFWDAGNFVWRDFQNTTEVLTTLNVARYRVGGAIILVDSGGTLNGNGTYTGGVRTYWTFRNGTADGNLVELNLFGAGGSCSGCLLAANNLSDVLSASTSRTNLGLGTMAVQNIAAGGDLSGNWPVITVAKFNGQTPSFYLNYNNLSNLPTIPAQFNPIAGSGIVLSGSYPNITFSSSGAGFNTAGVDLKAISSSTIGLDTQNYRKVDTLIGVNDSTLNYYLNGSLYSITLRGGAKGGGGGVGTVTTVSVVTANGVSGTVANPTSTPAITLTLGNITPTTVDALTLAALSTGFTISGGTTSKTLTVPLNATVSNTNTGDVTLTGENYLSITGQVINANPVNVSGTNITGVLKASAFPAQTGDVTNSAGSLTTTISNNAVTFAKTQTIGSLTIVGNNTGGTANESALTVAQVNAMLPVFTTTLNGLVPDPATVTGKVLTDNGTWVAPSSIIGLTQNQIAIGNASNLLSSSANLSYTSGGGPNYVMNMQWQSRGGINIVNWSIDPTNQIFSVSNGVTPSGGTSVASMSPFSLINITTASNIATYGVGNLLNITTGSQNTAFGTDVFPNVSATATGNIGMGYAAGSGNLTGALNLIMIGNSITKVTPGSLVNTTVLGNSISTDSSNVAILGTATQRIVLGNGGGNTAAMNALNNGYVGAIFFNTDSTLTGSGYCVWQGTKWINLGAASSSGGGSITGAGNLSPLFTTSVVGSTIAFSLTNAAANTAFGNFTGSSAAPAYGKVSLAAMATQSLNTLVANATGSTASPTAVPLGYGLIFQGGALALDSAHLKDTIYAVEGLSVYGTHMDSIGIGGTLYLDAHISGSNAHNLYLDSTILFLTGPNYSTALANDTSNYKLIVRKTSDGSTREMNWQAAGGGSSTLTRQNITSGTSATVTGGNYLVNFNPSSVITNFALTMPAAPTDQQVVEVEAGGTITSTNPVITNFSVIANAGQTLIQTATPTTINSGGYMKWRYNISNTSWYREN